MQMKLFRSIHKGLCSVVVHRQPSQFTNIPFKLISSLSILRTDTIFIRDYLHCNTIDGIIYSDNWSHSSEDGYVLVKCFTSSEATTGINRRISIDSSDIISSSVNSKAKDSGHYWACKTTCTSPAKYLHNIFRCLSSSPSRQSLFVPSYLHRQVSFFTTVSPVMGQIKPYRGFVTPDIRIDINNQVGGFYGRGVFANSNITYGREIIRVPAAATYVGDEPMRVQVTKIVQELYRKIVSNDPMAPYIMSTVMSMMTGGCSYFMRERDVEAFADTIPGGRSYIDKGHFTVRELMRLPQIIEFNRYTVEYRGRSGVCIFPEGSYFNHQCDPNVEISIRYEIRTATVDDDTSSVSSQTVNSETPVGFGGGEFVLSARAIKPIMAGEELFVNYIPGNDLPISRLSSKMRERWGFECNCVICSGRSTSVLACIIIIFMIPIGYVARNYQNDRYQQNIRKMSI